jgi:hypothetical protein
MRRALEASFDGGHQPGVLVGDDELHPLQSPGPEFPEELPPEGLVLRVPDIDAQDLPVSGGGHPGGDDHRLGRHLMVLSDVEVVGGRTGARCQHLGWSFPRPAPPNRTCDFHRIRLSTSNAANYAATPSVVAQGVGMRSAR